MDTLDFIKTFKLISAQDPVTGLPCLPYFREKIEEKLRQIRNDKNIKLSLFLLNIREFSSINNNLGYQVGDEILERTAERILDWLEDNWMAARLGGDRFLVAGYEIVNRPQIAEKAHSLLSIFEEPFSLGGSEFYLKAALGISIFPDDGYEIEELLTKAAGAVEEIKGFPGNQFAFAGSYHNLPAVSNVIIQENELLLALERKELSVFYQPIIRLPDEKITGSEALIRWHHPDKGLISPGDFIPLAERTGIIKDIGDYVLNESVFQHDKWIRDGYNLERISINLSASQLEDNLLGKINRLSAQVSEPGNIGLEITERMAIKNITGTAEVLEKIKKELGVSILLDDFGTGFSSLNYITKLPIDYLKVDRSFIKDITENEMSARVVAAIITLAHNFNFKVVAEGVETEAQLKFLLENNCDLAQGYYFSRPVPAEEFE